MSTAFQICGFEYGISNRDDPSEPWRKGMSVEEATEWLTTWVDMQGIEDPFKIIRRPVGEWEAG